MTSAADQNQKVESLEGMVSIMEDTLIVLTATTVPPLTPQLRLRDPGERLAQYMSSLRKWSCVSKELRAHIWFLDNSPRADLARLSEGVAELADQRRITFYEIPIPEDVHLAGKGVGEAALFDAVASLLTKCGPQYQTLIKCTGRLTVLNAAATLTLPARGPQVALHSTLAHADSRFFAVPRKLWIDQLSGMGEEVSEAEGVWLEHVLAKRVLRAVSSGVPFQSFRCLPRYSGMSASTGAHYDTLSRRMARAAHDTARRLVLRRGLSL
jgi:hypothetical protein